MAKRIKVKPVIVLLVDYAGKPAGHVFNTIGRELAAELVKDGKAEYQGGEAAKEPQKETTSKKQNTKKK